MSELEVYGSSSGLQRVEEPLTPETFLGRLRGQVDRLVEDRALAPTIRNPTLVSTLDQPQRQPNFPQRYVEPPASPPPRHTVIGDRREAALKSRLDDLTQVGQVLLGFLVDEGEKLTIADRDVSFVESVVTFSEALGQAQLALGYPITALPKEVNAKLRSPMFGSGNPNPVRVVTVWEASQTYDESWVGVMACTCGCSDHLAHNAEGMVYGDVEELYESTTLHAALFTNAHGTPLDRGCSGIVSCDSCGQLGFHYPNA